MLLCREFGIIANKGPFELGYFIGRAQTSVLVLLGNLGRVLNRRLQSLH